MRFQYFSDLHLECYVIDDIYKFNIEANAPFLILAGDIGWPDTNIYIEFLKYVSTMFEYVFLISGNHEYFEHNNKNYNDFSKIQEIDLCIRSVVHNLKNVIYLQNDIFIIPETDLIIYGGTFWTNIKEEEEEYIITTTSDFKHIPNITPDKVRKLHSLAVNELTYYLNKYENKKFIVISHHLPQYSLINSIYLNEKNNSTYATDIKIADNERIINWICGHTHYKTKIGKFLVNPIGYPNQNQNVNFNEYFEVI